MSLGTITTILAVLLGAGGVGGFLGTLTTRRKIVSEAKLTDGQLSEKVNNMLIREVERMSKRVELTEERFESCKTACREAKDAVHRLTLEHELCTKQLKHLEEEVIKLRDTIN